MFSSCSKHVSKFIPCSALLQVNSAIHFVCVVAEAATDDLASLSCNSTTVAVVVAVLVRK